MTQSREAGSTPEGGYYLRREQTWATPDGTPIRSHESQISGTSPENFQRERTITLRDGRTIEHTYAQTLDQGTLQTERGFSGPNGQTWSREQTWIQQPDGTWVAQPNPPAVGQPAPTAPAETMSAPVTTPEVGQPAPAKSGWFGLWGGKDKADTGSAAAHAPIRRPSGFTLGSSRGNLGTHSQGLKSRQPGPPESTPAASRRAQASGHSQGQGPGLSASRSNGRANR